MAYYTGAGDAEEATPAQALAIPSVVVEDLPTTSMGKTITWSFSQAGLVASDGKVTLPASPVTGTLTAVVDGATVSATVSIEPYGGDLATWVRTGVDDPLAYQDDRRADSLYVAAKPAGETAWEPLNRNQALIAVKWDGAQSTNPNAQMGSPEIFRYADGSLGAVSTANNAASIIYVWDTDSKNVFRNERKLTVTGSAIVKDAHVVYDAASSQYKVYWRNAGGVWFVSFFNTLNAGATATAEYTVTEAHLAAATGALPAGADTAQASRVALSAAEFEPFYLKYVTLQNTSLNTSLNQNLNVGDPLAPLPSQVELGYNDGSTKKLNVEWNAAQLAAVNTATAGVYEVEGTVQQDDYAYPFIAGRADPHMFYNEDDGYWYVTGSHYNQAYDGAISQPQSYRKLGLRRATTIDGLKTATEAIIYDPDSTGGVGYSYSAFIWAPEFHKINGNWWIVVGMQSTYSTNGNYPNATVIIPFKKDTCDASQGDMLLASCWGTPISLGVGASWDVSYWEKNGQGYWISPPSGDMTFRVYKAQMGDGVTPLPQSSSYSVIYSLTYPMHYGKDNWTATSEGTDHGVIEGPYIIEYGDYLYLVYSMGTVDKYYALGALMADKDADISDPAAWTDVPYVLMSSEDVSSGQIGGAAQQAAGHNSVILDDAGNLMNIYHARPDPLPQEGASGAGGLFDPSRSIAINSVNVRADGTLELAITSDQEVAPEYKTVKAYITVGGVVPVTGIEITGTGVAAGAVTVDKGNTLALTATVTPTNATVADVEWSTSAGTIVSVTQAGVITALLHGSAVITATAKDGSGVSASITVTVPAPYDPLEPILWYDFEDGSGTKVTDLTLNHYDGTISGAAVWENGTLKFDGTNDVVRPPNGILAGLHEITISFDSKTTATTEAKSWVFYAAASTAATTYTQEKYLAIEDMTGSVNVQRWNNTGSRENSASVSGPGSSDWKHVDLVITDTYTRLYIDGQLAGEATGFTGRSLTDILGTSGGIIQLGKANWTSAGEWYTGNLDNFKIYDKALTPDDFLTDTGLYLNTNSQVLSDTRSTEGGQNVVTVVLDYWSPTGNLTGEVSDKSAVALDFYVKDGSTLTLGDGSALPASFDLTNPVTLKVTPPTGDPVLYQVRGEVLVTPVRIPGLTDGTGVTGMKFFADPEVFVDGDKYYIYPTTDGYSSWRGWQIHAFESSDLVTWTDKGVVVDLQDQNLDGTPDTSILPSRTSSAWAPAMAKRDGNYYLYFSGGGQSNVAISSTSPYSGFVLQNAVVGNSIDPDVFQDPQTGKWYFAWGQSGIQYCELEDSMTACKSGTTITQSISGFREGSYFTAREVNGVWTYYFSYSVNDTNEATYHVRYATATSMAGPWTYRAEVLNQDTTKGILGTGHHSVLQVPGTDDWYVVYHAFMNDGMRPRLTDTGTGSQIATGNKREVRIARLTYTEPTDGSMPLWNRIAVTYEGVLPETVPQVSIAGDEGALTAGTVLTASFNYGWAPQSWQWYRDGVAITGETNATYTLTAADAGATVSVKGIGVNTTGVLNNAGDGPSVTYPIEGVAGQADTTDYAGLLNAIVLPPELAAGDKLPAESNGEAVSWEVTAGSITLTGGVTVAGASATGSAAVTLKATAGTASRSFNVTVLGDDHATLGTYTTSRTTRNVDDPELTLSVHLGLQQAGGAYVALNSGAGVIFPTNETMSTTSYGTRRYAASPSPFRLSGGGFGVLANRVQADGTVAAADRGKVLVFTSPDGVQWTEVGMLALSATMGVTKATAAWDAAAGVYQIVWTDHLNVAHLATSADLATAADALPGLRPVTVVRTVATGISYAQATESIPVTAAEGDTLSKALDRVHNTSVTAPAGVAATPGATPVLPSTVTANYSDGGTYTFPVDWNAADIAAVVAGGVGTYTVNGTLRFQGEIFPIKTTRADPNVYRYTDPVSGEKSWLFISTDDSGQDEFFVRQASTLAGLATATDNRILGTGLCGTTTNAQLWAPEFHEVDGELYLIFAATPNCNNAWNQVQAYTMKLKPGESPLLAASWETPQRVQDKNGNALTTLGTSISLDMTHFREGGKDYVVWSDRIISPSAPAVLKIAEVQVSATGAWKLKSDAVVLSLPETTWDWNTSSDAVDEGPYAIQKDGKIYITFSGSGVNNTYAVGLLTADASADLLDPASWAKRTYPIWSNEGPITNNWGPGHNSYVYDDDGNLFNIFHAMATSSGSRDSGLRMVYFRQDGSPILDMTDAEWLTPENRTVAVTVTVSGTATDKSALAAAVAAAEALNQADYTTASWGPLAQALADGQDVLGDPVATQDEIDDATAALEAALAGLVPLGDKTVLEVWADGVEALIDSGVLSPFTDESVEALEEALEAAQQVLDDPQASQDEVDQALEDLQDALSGLEPKGPGVNKSALEALVDVAEAMDSSVFTEDSWEAVDDALEAAQAVLDDPDATQTEVDAALADLQDALTNLVTVQVAGLDKSALQALVDANQATYDAGNTAGVYTTGSWTAFVESFEAAVAELASTESTTGSVAGAYAALAAGQAGLTQIGTITPGTVSITGTVKVGELVTVSAGSWSPADTQLAYQWKLDGVDISGAVTSTYAVKAADAGKTLTVTVTGVKTDYNQAVATSPGVVVASGTVTAGQPSITGLVKVGSTVTAAPGSWTPADVSLAYQWKLNGTDITGATAASYTLLAADAGKTLTVTVTGTKAGYTTASGSSAGVQVAAGELTAGVVTVTGTVKVGQTVTANGGTWSPAPVTLAYQWLLDGVEVSGATSASYAIAPADAGKSLSVKVTGSKTGYAAVTAVSAGTGVAYGTLTAGTPVVSGTAQVGQTVTGSSGSWGPAPVTLVYQWQVDGVDVGGATGTSYAPTAADVGKTLTVKVTGSKAGYTSVSASSGGQVVQAGVLTAGSVTVSGLVQVGQTVTANAGTWSPADSSLVYQWLLDEVVVAGAENTSYVVQPGDAGKSLSVRVTGAKAGYTTVSAVSDGQIVEPGVLTVGVVTVSGVGEPGQTLVVDPGVWLPAGVGLSFRWLADGQELYGQTGSTFMVTAARVGQVITVRVTGVLDGFEVATVKSDGVTVAAGTITPGSAVVSGVVEPGQMVTAVPGMWTPADVSLTYQWLLDGVVIAGATSGTYMVQVTDVGKSLSVVVSGVKAGYTPASATSEGVVVAPVVEPPPDTTYEVFSLSPDLSGDGRGDILAVKASTGGLVMFTTTASGTLSTSKTLVSSGLNGHRVFGPGDWNGDKKADVITVDTAGTMWLRAGNGAGGLAAPVQCGRGWSAYRIVPAGDLNGDGANDMLAIDSAGVLWLYAGNGKGGFLSGRTEVGHGWSSFELYAAGDLNGDGKVDILGVNASGDLYAYMGKGNGQFQAALHVGRGWTGFTLASGADLNGDGRADVVGRNDTSRDLYFYAGKGTGSFDPAKKIASAW
jgi:GH43 family beta-xylosidase